MPRLPVRVIVVALLVTTAGCNGFLTPSDGSQSPVSPETLPPGVSQDGVTNVSRLVDAHLATLGEQGFRSETVVNVTLASNEGPTRSQENHQVVQVESGYEPFAVNATTTSMGRSVNTQYWGNASLELSRTKRGSQVQYAQLPPEFNLREYLGFGSSLSLLVELGDYEVTATNQSGDRTLHTLEASSVNTSFDGGESGLSAENVSDLSSTLVVDSRGVIHSLSMTFDANTAQGTVSYNLSYDLTDTGAITVEKPTWIQPALANVTTLDLDVQRDGNVLRLTHTGGDPLPANSIIGIETGNGIVTATVQSELTPGETLYVAVNESGSTLTVSREQISEGQQLDSTVRVVVYSPRGSQLFATTITTNQTTTT